MTAGIIDGAAVALRRRQALAAQIAEAGLTPGLAVLLVGDNPASQVYVKSKGKAAEEVGMKSWTHRLPSETTEAEVLAKIDEMNRDREVHGILVQLPLPPQIDADRVIGAIDPAKDVDGFHPINAGKLALGLQGFVPCTPRGCMILIQEVTRDLAGMRAVILGRSNIVGKPMMQLLLQANATPTIAHSKSKDLPDLCNAADVLIAAIGRPNFVKGEWVKKGAIIIDVGINRILDGDKKRLTGDVDFDAAKGRAGFITPVPGGVGPMTIACLLENTFHAASAARREGASATAA